MIPLTEINSVMERFNVPGETIEKDYVISWILTCLARSRLKKDFVFYGGTAIKKIYFEDHRFSEDIDLFTARVFQASDLLENFSSAFQYSLKKTNLSLRIDPKRIVSTDERVQIFVQYSGYDEIIGSPKEVRMDIVMGTEPYGEVKNKRILGSYSDLEKMREDFPAQTLNTILAGKLGLLLDIARKEPRDLFDIWFILNRCDRFDFNKTKMAEIFKEKYGFYPAADILKPCLKNKLYAERWENRLKKQIALLPPADIVLKDIERQIEHLFAPNE